MLPSNDVACCRPSVHCFTGAYAGGLPESGSGSSHSCSTGVIQGLWAGTVGMIRSWIPNTGHQKSSHASKHDDAFTHPSHLPAGLKSFKALSAAHQLLQPFNSALLCLWARL